MRLASVHLMCHVSPVADDRFALWSARVSVAGARFEHRSSRPSPRWDAWLTERLNETFQAHGKVPADTLAALDWPTIP